MNNEQLIESIYNEVVSVFGAGIPQAELAQYEDRFTDLSAKTIDFLHANGLQYQPGIIVKYAQQIKDMPVASDATIQQTVAEPKPNATNPNGNATIQMDDLVQFKKDTNMFVKYALLGLGSLFIAILSQKLAKTIAAVGLFVIALLLFKYYSNKNNTIKKSKDKK